MEAANKRVANILRQLLPIPLSGPAEAIHEQPRERQVSDGSSVANLGRRMLALEECRSDAENGNALHSQSGVLPDAWRITPISLESCRAKALDEKSRGFACRLRGDSIEQSTSLVASNSEKRFVDIQVPGAEPGSGSARLQELRLGVEGLEAAAAAKESRNYESVRKGESCSISSTEKQASREWICFSCEKREGRETDAVPKAQSLAVEGLRAMGLKQQSLRGLSSFQLPEMPNPFLPPPLVGVSSSSSSSSLSVTTEPAEPITDKCIFCEIVRGKAPAFKLYEDEFCICILDINPLAHGHSLVIPKLHCKNLQTTPPRIAAAMCATVPILSKVIMEATNCDSFNMVVNSGAAAGQVVHHTHYHIIPRCDGDGLWHSETAPRRPFMGANEAAGFVRLVRNRLAYL